MRQPRIGIVCYPSLGGSGIVATELGMAMAARGCQVHFISYAPPMRLKGFLENVQFHQVFTDNYPVFHHPPYILSLATKLVEVVTQNGLDIVHAHYAVPHATSAFLARAMLGDHPVKTVTTLHGTDITLVGAQPSFRTAVRFSIEESDGVTAVSEWLRVRTIETFGLEHPIEVIPNFVDTARFTPREKACSSLERLRASGRKVIMHASNFRAVKNVPGVIRVFDRIQKEVPSYLVLIGEGPELTKAHEMASELGLSDRVLFLGLQDAIDELLPEVDLLLLPSEHESFGLVALEAMAAGVPVIATNQGGTAEILESGVHGFLAAPHDVAGMAEFGISILRDSDAWHRMSKAARARAVERFDQEKVIERYLDYYRRVISGEVHAVKTRPARLAR
ncbi:MAG: N-acetyl-alpha-D-glucosaminyl L-malate synthase BshA [Candidatus Eisenbacteria bacterium]|nr:N-acetyl-alpha-D-glucosaminyl L-malate synthase BshA [Candidatus Eisenbacteria bacterium]